MKLCEWSPIFLLGDAVERCNENFLWVIAPLMGEPETSTIKAHVFRDFGYSPSPITSIASNGKTIAVFRRSQFVDLVDSHTFKPFVRHNIAFQIVQSGFLDINTIIGLTACQKVLVIDIATLSVEVHDIQALYIAPVFNDAAFSERTFLYVSTRNELRQFSNGSTSIVRKECGNVSAMLAVRDGVLLGTEDGWVGMYSRESRVAEVEIGSKINCIAHIKGHRYVVVASNGSAYIIDIENKIVQDKVAIRTNPLTVVVCLNGVAHISGHDSRIIAYGVDSGRFVKITQSDFHVAEVTSMAIDNSYILTGGEDTVLISNSLVADRYTARRVCDASVQFGHSRNLFYATSAKSINFFKRDAARLETDTVVKQPSEYADRMSFKVSSSILERINQPRMGFPFFLKFNTLATPVAAAISQDDRYFAYSTTSQTFLYDLICGSNLKIEKIREFSAATQIVFTDKLLAIVGLDKQITIFSLDTFKVIAEIPFNDLRERIAIVGNTLIMANMKQIIDINNQGQVVKIDTEQPIGEIQSYGDDISLLIYPKPHQCLLYELGIATGTLTNIPFEGGDATGVLGHTNKTLLYTDKLLFIQKDGRLRKYELGNIIHGAINLGNDILVFQTSWNYLRSNFKPSVFKPKFSN